MRPQGIKQQLAIRRRVAMALLDVGWGIRQGARQVKASPGSVCRWRDTLAQQGEAGLTAKRYPGSKPKLNAVQRQQLLELLSQGARAHGFRHELWTLQCIAIVIERHFGCTYCPSGIWHLLRRCKWSPQKPARRARERNEGASAQWPTDVWPRLKKTQDEDRTIVFLDQTGFMLQPTVRRTCSLQGQTPVHDSWDRHDRLSVTGAITVSPVRQRVGLYFSIASCHITGDDVFAFVQHLRWHLRRPLLLIWDRFSGHRKAARLLCDLYGTRIQVVFLLAYAPELNVVEHCWNHTKYGEMANFIPHDVAELADEVTHSLVAKHRRPDLLHAFFHHARVDL